MKNNWEVINDEELEMMLDLHAVELEEPLPESELVRGLRAIGDLVGVTLEDL